jgi:hypothetical protein
MRDIRAKSAWFAAIANGHLGKFNEAKEYRAIAIKNGSQLAASRSIPTPRTRCQGNAKLGLLDFVADSMS